MDLARLNHDFRLLLGAQSISQIGAQISFLAVPLVAANYLDATAVQMGILTAVGAIPALATGLFLGALVDRVDRKSLLVSADLARCLLLMLIPIAWLAGFLSLPVLYLVTVISGVFALLFDIAYSAFLPQIVDRKRLVAANSALEMSRSTAEVIGPSLAGVLIQILKAPVALVLDALSFAASAVMISRIRQSPEARSIDDQNESLFTGAREGVRRVWTDPGLRYLALTAALLGLFNAMIEAVFVLYLAREIGMSAGVLGFVFAIGSLGFMLGALLPDRVVRLFGPGPGLAIGIAVVGLSDVVLPLAGTDIRRVAVGVAIGQFGFGLGMTLFNVVQASLRQALVEHARLGRVGGALRIAALAPVPIGALVGGVLGSMLGLRETLLIGAILEVAIALVIWQSPLWNLRDADFALE